MARVSGVLGKKEGKIIWFGVDKVDYTRYNDSVLSNQGTQPNHHEHHEIRIQHNGNAASIQMCATR